MMQTSWLDAIRSHALVHPEAIAVVESRGRAVSRERLVRMVEGVMSSLQREGFGTGDKVLFSVKPGIDALVLVLAVHELGGVLLPMDPGVCDALFASRMALLAPRWVFAQGVLLAPQHGLVMRILRARNIQFAPLGAVAGARYVHVGIRVPGARSSTSFRALLRQPHRTAESASAHSGRAEYEDESPAFVVCTSGTTAHPKAVVHSRRSLRAIVNAIGAELALVSDDVMYARDLHLLLPALVTGARAVIPRESAFDARRTLRTMTREGVTHAFLVTRDCRLLLDECIASGKRVPDSLRSLMIGAAPVRASFLARLREVLPQHTVAWCVYGATEVLPVARVSLEEKLAFTGEGDLVGRTIPGVSVRTDEAGQLCITGDRLFSGYAGEATVAEHATGDLARLDGDLIVLMGRAKDMIIRGEHNIYPALYEPLVERVEGVRRAALVGDFDSVLADERVILVVEPERGVEAGELRARVAHAVKHGPHRLDSSAQPDEIIVRAIPESGRSHKVDKTTLRRELRAAAAG
jgi:acyl-CoA synthetase (AMP-forming)/AMP-acid ligase II